MPFRSRSALSRRSSSSFFFQCYGDHRDLHSFPTRRSSDLATPLLGGHTHHETTFDDFRRQSLLPERMSQLGPGLAWIDRSEEHTSELQSQFHLVCRLLLEKKKQPVHAVHRTMIQLNILEPV